MFSSGGVSGQVGARRKVAGPVEEQEDIDESESDESDYYAESSEAAIIDVPLDAADETALKAFFPSENREPRTLADIIMQKIKEAESGTGPVAAPRVKIPEKAVEVYREVGKILSRYSSGKLPKAFKIIPSLRNWEDILFLTNPDDWTPNAVYEATRIFTSTFNPKMAQRFFNIILLPRIQNSIASEKKLNFHLYMSLKKALFKPAAFFKGILLPLCEPGYNCTLREAVILGSILQRRSIPVLHASAALLKIAEMDYSGACICMLSNI